MTRYFEDFSPGQRFDLGSVVVTEDEILDFARQFDPQPFHTDPVAAARSPFGGLIASGWHTGSLFMRLYADSVLADADSQGSPGVEAMRWLAPVRPGDRLTGTSIVDAVMPSSSNPRRGTVVITSEMTNEDDVVVMRLTARGLFGRRPA
jgi:acyl dehydratase